MSRGYLPALRGHIGDWTFYSCLFSLRDLAARVHYAKELHKNKNLSDLIQRRLKDGRGKEISSYLKSQDERFFSSLVIAVYGGDPAWHPFGKITSQRPDISMDSIPESARESLGFLSFSGKEKLFAIDGQHRLAGVKATLTESSKLADEMVSVLLIAHKNTSQGFQRSRRVFTTLNKTAKPVAKGEIVALDEDDVMAICTRRLVETNPVFMGDRISYNTTANLPSNDRRSLTTIVNLYDVLALLFSRVDKTQRLKDLRNNRPKDNELDRFYRLACRYFELLGQSNRPVGKFFKAKNPGAVAKKCRGAFGGHLLFRPLGLRIATEIIAKLHGTKSLASSVKAVSALPLDLSKPPYRNVIWNPHKKKMVLSGAALAKDLMMFMLGIPVNQEDLAIEYGKALRSPTKGKEMLLKLRSSG